MKVSIFEEADRQDVLRIQQETFGQLKLERFWWQACRQIESLEKDSIKLVCKDNRRVKGYAAVYPAQKKSFRLNLLIDPQYTAQGIGTVLLREIEIQAKKAGALGLEARIIEGMDDSLAFALSKGFVALHRMRGMSLRAQDFSFENRRSLGEKLSAEGFTATTLEAEECAGEKPLEKLIELQKYVVEGWARTNLLYAPDVSDAQLRRVFSYITFPERVLIMKHGKEYVAYTSAERENMLGTATHPKYRGRGVATYLKALNLKKLIDGGADYFETSSANPAMLGINEKLGYKFNGLTEIRLVKDLQSRV